MPSASCAMTQLLSCGCTWSTCYLCEPHHGRTSFSPASWGSLFTCSEKSYKFLLASPPGTPSSVLHRKWPCWSFGEPLAARFPRPLHCTAASVQTTLISQGSFPPGGCPPSFSSQHPGHTLLHGRCDTIMLAWGASLGARSAPPSRARRPSCSPSHPLGGGVTGCSTSIAHVR